jgi:DNA-binding response OmpR family regulator
LFQPVHTAPLRDSLSDHSSVGGSSGVGPWPTLLVIDNDAEMLRTLTCFFEKRGFHVAAAATVAEAKTYFQRRLHWTMVIADYHLPDGNGWDFCAWMREQRAGQSSTPFLLMSGGTHAATVCPEIDFLAKPFGIEELEQRVRTLLRLRQN